MLTLGEDNYDIRIRFVEGPGAGRTFRKTQGCYRHRCEIAPVFAIATAIIPFAGGASTIAAVGENPDAVRPFHVKVSEQALAHYAGGDRPAADESLAELIATDRHVMAYQIAEVYAWRGEKDKAFE